MSTEIKSSALSRITSKDKIVRPLVALVLSSSLFVSDHDSISSSVAPDTSYTDIQKTLRLDSELQDTRMGRLQRTMTDAEIGSLVTGLFMENEELQVAKRVEEERLAIEKEKENAKKVFLAPPTSSGVAAASIGEGQSVWDLLVSCEATGDWHINTGNGFYGGLQFDEGTWLSNGGGEYGPFAHLATREQQIEIAEKLRDSRGYNPWPGCADRYGLR